ncbi:hypothetical protein V6N11_046438 [Hibiscus sabdariffa]|uniref:Uncharacterized protein n=1 Tax=Hibiscus sabdariffa TaxID=183260 RepID=A0ABR2P2J8_9ROSI
MGELREREKVRKVREWESSGKGRIQKHIQTTVFVSNLPPRLHWKDNLEDRKSKQMKNNELRNRETGKNLNIRVGESSSVSPDTLTQPRLKRVLGHVDEEALKKLEKCLIGTMATRDVPLQSKAKMTVDCSPESSSDSSSVSDHYTGSTNRSRSNCNGEDEVAKTICLEKGPLVDEISSKLNAGRSLGETVFLGNIQSQEMQPPNQMENSIPFQTSSEAVRSVLNVTSAEAIGPYIKVDHPVVSWADVAARHTLEQTSQGDRAGEVITRTHNQNGELDPVTGSEGYEAHSQRIPADKAMDREELGFCLSATKRNLKAEKSILSAGKLANCVNLDLESLTLPLSEFLHHPKSERVKRLEVLRWIFFIYGGEIYRGFSGIFYLLIRASGGFFGILQAGRFSLLWSGIVLCLLWLSPQTFVVGAGAGAGAGVGADEGSSPDTGPATATTSAICVAEGSPSATTT